MTLTWLDFLVIAIPFVVVVGVSVALRSYVAQCRGFSRRRAKCR